MRKYNVYELVSADRNRLESLPDSAKHRASSAYSLSAVGYKIQYSQSVQLLERVIADPDSRNSLCLIILTLLNAISME